MQLFFSAAICQHLPWTATVKFVMFWADNLSGCLLLVKGTYSCQSKLKLVVKWVRFESSSTCPCHVFPHVHPSVCPSRHLFGYLLGEVRASIVVGQLRVLLTLMNLKMPSDLKRGSTKAARVCEKQPQFVQQILPCHPLPFTLLPFRPSQAKHRGHWKELFPLGHPSFWTCSEEKTRLHYSILFTLGYNNIVLYLQRLPGFKDPDYCFFF